jgi:Ca2+ transporting ATPase
MGGADTICSDKTGTLTKNKMVLKEIWNVRPRIVDEKQVLFNLKGEDFKCANENNGDIVHLIRTSFCCNGSAILGT